MSQKRPVDGSLEREKEERRMSTSGNGGSTGYNTFVWSGMHFAFLWLFSRMTKKMDAEASAEDSTDTDAKDSKDMEAATEDTALEETEATDNTPKDTEVAAATEDTALEDTGAADNTPKNTEVAAYDSSDEILDPWCDPSNPRVVTFEEVTSAAFRIRGGITRTPCVQSHLCRISKMDIYLKNDFMQYTGSFKERGARNALLLLSEEQQNKGIVAASAGNHAQAVCYHGKDLGIPVTVVMPTIAPLMKIQACRNFGANVMVQGADMAETKKIAMKYAKDNDMLYLNGYDHPHILAGQGTIGLEIVEQVNNVDAVVCPVGGGGLIAGLAVAMKALSPDTKIIGVEAENCPAFTKSIAAGKTVYTKSIPSLADGLAVPVVGYNSFATAAPLIDKMVPVKEKNIALAILRLMELEKCVVEGAAACGLGAILQGDLDEFQGKRVVLILSGGNIDTTVLSRCLERGLAADDRLVKFTVFISDNPGGMSELCKILTGQGVSIKDLTPDRAFTKNDVFTVKVTVVCETRDTEHTAEMRAALNKRYGETVSFCDHCQLRC